MQGCIWVASVQRAIQLFLCLKSRQSKSTGLVDGLFFFYCFVSCEVQQLVLPVKLPNGLQMWVCYTIPFPMRPSFSSGWRCSPPQSIQVWIVIFNIYLRHKTSYLETLFVHQSLTSEIQTSILEPNCIVLHQSTVEGWIFFQVHSEEVILISKSVEVGWGMSE